MKPPSLPARSAAPAPCTHDSRESDGVSQAVILTAGAGSRIAIAAPGQPKALIRLGDVPVVVHQLQWLMLHGCRHVVIVHAPGDRGAIESVLRRALLGCPATLVYVEQTQALGPGDALAIAAEHLVAGDVCVLTADTFLDLDEPWPATDSLGVSDTDDPDSYCLVRTVGDEIVAIVDKPHPTPALRLPALVGLYRFADALLLRSVLDGGSRPAELKPIIDAYRRHRPLTTAKIGSWRDLGTYSAYVDASRSMLRGRSFHDFSVDASGSVSKRGPVDLIDREASWFEGLPGVSRAITPAVRSCDRESGELVLDLLDYPTLSSVWLFENHPAKVWAHVLAVAVDTMRSHFWEAAQTTGPDRPATWCLDRYVAKTVRRLERWALFDELRATDLQVDGRALPAFDSVWQLALPRLVEIAERCDSLVLTHGDATFSNILLARRFGFVRFIDPTSSMTGEDPWGDPRYDMAKLRQCYSGRYDTLARELFVCERTAPDEIHLQLFGQASDDVVAAMDAVLASRGFDLAEIRLLEALQFLSMGALHDEAPHRQLAMYVTGLSLLDDQLTGAVTDVVLDHEARTA